MLLREYPLNRYNASTSKLRARCKMSDSHNKELEREVARISDTVARLDQIVGEFSRAATRLSETIARHDENSKFQAQALKALQDEVKDNSSRIHKLEMLQTKTEGETRFVEHLRLQLAEIDDRLGKVEDSTLVNTTKLAPITAITQRVASALAVAAITGALTYFYMSGGK